MSVSIGGYTLLLISILCSLSTTSKAQSTTTVQVVLSVPPQNQFKTEHMWRVTLTNLSQESIPIVLEGVATTSEHGLIVRARTSQFNLPPGTRVMSAAMLQPIQIQQSSVFHEEVVKRTGNVPTGNYEICVSAIDARSNSVVGRGCVQATTVQLTRIQLLQPSNNANILVGARRARSSAPTDENGSKRVRSILESIGEVIGEQHTTSQHAKEQDSSNSAHPAETLKTDIISGTTTRRRTNAYRQQVQSEAIPYTAGTITFSWLPPAPAPAGARITYTLKLVEMVGRQSGYDALRSNPSLIEMRGLTNTVVVLPIAARRLEVGKSYAWSVEVYLNNVLMQNSEVYELSLRNSGQNTELGRCCGKPPPCECPPDQVAPLFPSAYSSLSLGIPIATTSNYQNQLFQNPNAPNVPTFALTGNSTIEYQNSNRIGSFSTTPRSFATANLNPGVNVFGLPFSANVLLSTLQDSSRQSMNMFSFNFDFNAMREGLANRLKRSIEQELIEYRTKAEAEISRSYPKLDDPNQLRSMTESEISEMQAEKQGKIDHLVERNAEVTYNVNSLSNPNDLASNLRKHAEISGAESFFLGIRSMGIGTNYPSYSSYILSGLPVTGLNAEVDQGLLYAAFTALTNQRPLDNLSYGRQLYAGRVGVGRLEGTHVILTGMYVNDDQTSISSVSNDPLLTPQQNAAFGVDVSVNLFDNVLTFQGEANASVLTRDTRDPELETNAIPTALARVIRPRISSQVDYVYAGKLVFNNPASRTLASAEYKMVGPGYASLGVPFLRTDIQGFEIFLNQSLFNDVLQLGGFVKQYSDNLISWKTATTTMTNLGVTLALSLPDLPFLQASYMPTTQSNDDTLALRQLNTDLNVYSIATGYTMHVDSWSFTTSLSVNGQQTINSNGLNDFSSTNYLLSEHISFDFPLQVGINYGIVETQSSVGYRIINSMEVNASYPVASFLLANAGLNVAAERGQNDRLGLFATASLVLTEALSLNMRAEKTAYNDMTIIGNNYDEFIFSASITSRW